MELLVPLFVGATGASSRAAAASARETPNDLSTALGLRWLPPFWGIQRERAGTGQAGMRQWLPAKTWGSHPPQAWHPQCSLPAPTWGCQGRGLAHAGSGPQQRLGPFSQSSLPWGRCRHPEPRAQPPPVPRDPLHPQGCPDSPTCSALSPLCPVPLTLGPLVLLISSQGWEGRGLLPAPRRHRGRQGLGSCLLGFEPLSGLW